MSEANTPKSSANSGNDSDAIDELMAFENDTDPSESLDELIASLDATETLSEVDDESESGFDDLSWLEAESETTAQPLAGNELQERNHQILRRNAELHQALESTQAELEQQQFRLRQAEELNAQQNDEINAASEQNLSLSQELKNYRLQEEQHQEKITQLTQQLQVSQQRVAQLERECALIQKQLQEQSYQLSQAEKYSRDLSFRLQQQRRHTWQFKSALNKYLGTNADEEEVIPSSPTSSQPIPAWSSQSRPLPLKKEPVITKAPATVGQQSDFATGKEQPLSVEESLAEEPEIPSSSNEATDVEANLYVEEERTSPPVYADKQTTATRSGKVRNNLPSPLLSSSRKKRQSYAAVELPSFLR